MLIASVDIMKLLILHGWAYSIEKWEPFLKALKEKGIDAKMLQIPGLTTQLSEVWNLDNYISWLERITKNEKRITLLGHSNGGRISIAFAAKHPEKVEKLVLIDSAGIYHEDFAIQLKRFVFGHLARLKKFANTSFLQTLFYKLVREYDYHKATPVMKKVLQNLLDSDKDKRFERVNVPTLLIWGEDDNITPISDGKLMNEKIKGSKLYIVKSTMHSPQYTNADEISEQIFKFLNHNNQ